MIKIGIERIRLTINQFPEIVVNSWSSESNTCPDVNPAAGFRAIIIRSSAGSSWWRWCRKYSRINRFNRLRTTALPTFLVIVGPTFDLPVSLTA